MPSTDNVAVHYMSANVLITVGETSTQLYHNAMPIAFTAGLGDGAVDTIVQVNCEFNNAVAPASMVLALRQGARGAIETVGVVVAGQGPSIKCFYGLGASGDEVRVLVGDACNEGDYRPADLRWRSYRLVDGVFIQSGGLVGSSPAGPPAVPGVGFEINHSR